jgi:hypothetical protein
MVQMEKWRDGHEDLSTDFLLTSSEERYVNLIDCAFSAVFVGWWGLGLLPLARVALSIEPRWEHVPLSLVENIMKSRTKKGAENSLHEVKDKTEKRPQKRMRDPTLEGRDENKVGRIPEKFDSVKVRKPFQSREDI